VCDSPSQQVHAAGAVMTQGEQNLVGEYAKKYNLPYEMFAFVTPCPPIPDDMVGSDSKESKFIKQYQDELTSVCNMLHNLKLIISFGALAAKQALNGVAKISKIRGQIIRPDCRSVPVLPMFSPKHVMRRPEARDYFDSDMRTLGELVAADFNFEQSARIKLAGDYRWVLDLSEVIAEMDSQIAERGVFAFALDTEFTGGEGKWYKGARLLVGQITFKVGSSVVFPLDLEYWNNHCADINQPPITQHTIDNLFNQLREITENPASFASGHALTADKHVLRNHDVEVVNHFTDTMQLCFVVDDNMLIKSLDEATRRWIPALSGYADDFNNDPVHQDKSRMDLVPLDKMLLYAGGDTDAAFRLTQSLTEEGQKDARNWKRYRAIHMPAINTFFEMERQGIRVDTTKLGELGVVLNARKEELYALLISGVSTAVVTKHKDAGLKFSRDAFVIDILFSPDGFNLTPVVFTKGTTKLAEADRVPSVSTKQHLPFFEGETPYYVTTDKGREERDWVSDYKEYEKVCTMIERYVGEPGREELEVKGTKRRSFDYAWEKENPDVVEEPTPNGSVWHYKHRLPNDLVKAGGIEVNGFTFKDTIQYPFGTHLKCLSDANALALDHAEKWADQVQAARISANILVKKTYEPSGFWQYLSSGNRVHPSFFMHRTNTGRSASASPNCFPPSVEVLTEIGWLNFGSVPTGTKIAQVDKDSGSVSFSLPTDTIAYEFNGELVHIHTDYFIDLIATPDHRFFVKDRRTGKFNMPELRKYPKDALQVSAGILNGSVDLPDYVIGLRCALQADGHVTKHKAIDWVFKKSRKADRLVMWLKKAGIAYEDYSTEDKYRYFIRSENIPDWLVGWKQFNWEILDYTKELLSLFCSELFYWDGDFTRHSTWTSKIKMNADIVQAAFVLNGSRAYVRVASNATCSCFYVVNITEGKGVSGTRNQRVEKVSYSGAVHCFTMPKDTLIVRYNGRVAVAGNCQNIPKRGPLAKAYRKIFKPYDGWVFIEGDLSQAELRVAAIMARERTMLRVYADGGDIHAETAAATMGLSTDAFYKLDPETIDLKRFQAKAVNFGFLYGMWWTKFKAYAKTDYGIDFTDREAKEMREAFFRKYSGLERWHESMRAFARSHGYVRGLHGALRRLPNMASHDEKIRQDCERQGINAPVQGFASDMGICGMNRFSRDCPHDLMHPVAFIHDAVVVHAREDVADEAASALKFYMESFPAHWFDADGQGTPLNLPIPIVSDLKMSAVSGNLSEMRDRKDLLAAAPSWYQPELDAHAPF
jgi:DNA polymerase I-like protein with 3'-5' exonuclease and polymerase domains